MNIGLLIFLIILAVVVVNIVVMLIITMRICKVQWADMFERETPQKWGRENSCPSNAEHSVMFDAGIAWGEANSDKCIPIEIINDGLKLKGEYFDFGQEKTCLFLAGRAESLLYSYYFAETYANLGYNVLVIDPRAHGESEGKYSSVGIKETGDAIAWMDYVHERFNQNHFIIHGICIGSATAIYAAARQYKYLEAIVLEGPFISFYNVLIQRMRAIPKPWFPMALEMAYTFKKKVGVNIFKERPLNYLPKVKVPALFLCGKEDASSLPKYFDRLYAACGSEIKECIWFEHGAHSHLRIANKEQYDNAIDTFLKEFRDA